VARAQQLFADTGWQRAPDGPLLNVAGEQLTIPWQVVPGDTEFENLGNAVMAYWKQMGVESAVTVLGAAQARQLGVSATFPGATVSGGDTTLANQRTWWHSSGIPREENRFTGSNTAGWVNPQADQLLDRLVASLSEQAQQDDLVELAKLWTNDLPVLPMWLSVEVVSISSRVQGAAPRPLSGPVNFTLWNIHEWDVN
jgi:peptide/nickel transport system substrate-binding protein